MKSKFLSKSEDGREFCQYIFIELSLLDERILLGCLYKPPDCNSWQISMVH